MSYLLGEPRGLLATPGVAQKLIDVVQAGAGKHALVTDMLEVAHQVAEQIDLEVVARSKIDVAAFGWKGPIAASSFSQQSSLA